MKTIEYIVDEKINEKVRKYLMKNFPGFSLIRYVLLKNNKAEVYGLDGIQIKVVKSGKELFYQIIKNK